MMEGRHSGSHRDKKHDGGDHGSHFTHSDALSSGEQWSQPHKKSRLVDADTQAQYMDRSVLQPPRYQPQLAAQLASDKVDSAVQYSPTEVSFVSQVANLGAPVFPNMNMMNNSFYGFAANTGGHFNSPAAGGFYGFPPHSLGNFGLGKNDLLPVNVSASSSSQNNASVSTSEGGGFVWGQSSQSAGLDLHSVPHSQSQSQTHTSSTSTSTSSTHSISIQTQSQSTGTNTNGAPGPSSSSVGPSGPRTTKPKTFHCSQCESSFTRADHLTRHVKKKHLGQIAAASGSGLNASGAFKYFGSTTLSLLNGSGKERKPEGPKQFFCMLCNSGFTRRDHLTRHNKRQHPTDNTTNASCQTPATAEFGYGCGHRSSGGEGSSQQLEKEIGKLSSNQKPVHYHACPLCGKLFTRQDHMKRHQKIHARGEPVKCGECQMWFPEKGQLNQHMLESHHIQVFECCYCSKSFYECEFLTRHLKEKHNVQDAGKQTSNGHLGIAEPRYRCGICTLQFNKESECTTHMLHHVVPTASLVAAIPFGSSAQSADASMAAAQLAAVSQAEMWSRFSFPPERTGQYVSNGLNVPQFPHPQSHQAAKDNNPFASNSMLFSMANHKLDQHAFGSAFSPAAASMSSAHTAEMSVQAESGQFLCGVCGSSFTKASDLKQHIKRHADDRPHGCHDCGASFTSATNLVKHQRTHSGQRPFRCSQPSCESAFTHKGALINHERIHTGERPFVCDLCEATFTRKDALDRHKRTHKENRIKQEREMSTSTDDLHF